MTRIDLMDGKYTIINELNEGGGLYALRHGEEWRNLAGDNLVLAMAHEIEELRFEVEMYEDIIEFRDEQLADMYELYMEAVENDE